MSNNVAAILTRQLWHTSHLGLQHDDRATTGAERRRAGRHSESSSDWRSDARIQPLVNPEISTAILAESLDVLTDQTWVAEQNGVVVGHLYGALLESEHLRQRRVDRTRRRVLRQHRHTERPLQRGRRARGSSAARSSTTSGRSTTSRPPSRGTRWDSRACTCAASCASNATATTQLPEGYALRRGDRRRPRDRGRPGRRTRRGPARRPEFLHRPRSHRPSATNSSRRSRTPRCTTTSSSSTGHAVAQCITFPLPPRRGSFDHTLHLSAVTVDAEHRHRRRRHGHGRRRASRRAASADFEYVETNWRVTNRRARNYWLGYGFEPTYVRLHRTIGLG